jgi:hypothetical protein
MAENVTVTYIGGPLDGITMKGPYADWVGRGVTWTPDGGYRLNEDMSAEWVAGLPKDDGDLSGWTRETG